MKHLILIALLSTACAPIAQPKDPQRAVQAYSPCQPHHTVCFTYKDTRVRTLDNKVLPQSYAIKQRNVRPKHMLKK